MASGTIKQMTEYLFDDSWAFPATSINANAVADVSKNVTKSGYTAVAFLPMTTQNANAVWIGFKPLSMSGANTAVATLKNLASSSQTITARFTVIYKKN